jgi:hypothetical protein
MVKYKKSIVLFIIFFTFSNISYSIESAAHKVEVAKCFGVIMTIKNNSKYEENKFKAAKILDLYLDKIIRLNIGSIMMKEMSEKAAGEVFYILDSTSPENINKLLDKCVSTLRIG